MSELNKSQKRQKDQVVRIIKTLAYLESNMDKTNNYVDKIRHGQQRINSSRSHSKQKSRDEVTPQMLVRMKERVNYGF